MCQFVKSWLQLGDGDSTLPVGAARLQTPAGRSSCSIWREDGASGLNSVNLYEFAVLEDVVFFQTLTGFLYQVTPGS